MLQRLNPFSLDVNYEKRVFGLDIVRALAILQVVITHGGSILQNLNTDYPWYKLISGVEIFFVLSGFLIGTIIISTFEKSGISFGVIIKFLKRRWLRTLPNYYLILLVNIALVYFGITNGDFSQFNFKFFLFLHNFSTPFYGFFMESWSLSIEEWFYLLFPAAILSCAFLFKHNVKILVISIAGLFAVVPFLLRVFALHNENMWTDWYIQGVVIYKLDAIAIGIIGAWIKAYYKEYWYNNKNPLFFTGLILIYIYMYVDKMGNPVFYRIVNDSVMTILILLMLPMMDSIKQGKGAIAKVVTHISLISYSMYLLNLGVVAAIITSNFALQSTFEAVSLYVVYWIVLIVLSSYLYKFFEKPIMDLRD